LSTQKEDRIVRPDFVLIRNFPRNIHGVDYRNILIGLMYAKLPAVNSLESVFMAMERPLMYAELNSIRRRLGNDKFPVIDMNYYPNQMIHSVSPYPYDSSTTPSFPLVCKVGSTHAGYGKIQAESDAQFKDMRSVLALHQDYYTTEPFIQNIDYEFRVQKIGEHYRAFKRNSDTSWKRNWGNLQFEDHPMKNEYKIWADECAKIFGGLDILAIDILHTKDNKDVIIEVNDTACGLMWDHEEEDIGYIREVVLKRMNSIFCKK